MQYLVLVLPDLLRVPLWRWPKIVAEEVMSGRYYVHWPIIAGSVDHTSVNIAAQLNRWGVFPSESIIISSDH